MKRRVGCVLVREKRVISTGYNGTPRHLKNCNEGGCKIDTRLSRIPTDASQVLGATEDKVEGLLLPHAFAFMQKKMRFSKLEGKGSEKAQSFTVTRKSLDGWHMFVAECSLI